jgi:putative sterol carrier protein
MKVFSEQWAQAFAEEINTNEAHRQAAMGWEWPLILQMKNGDNEKSVFLDLQNGECKFAKVADQNDSDAAEFIISASSDSWQKILNKELDPMLAVMTKKLELKKGNVGTLLKYVEAAKELIKSATKIPAEF